VNATPRTDAAEGNAFIGIVCFSSGDMVEAYNFARQLDRELAQSVKYHQVMVDEVGRLSRELNEAIRQRDLYLKDRDIVMQQRDELQADKRRLDWLEYKVVNVRLPLVHGSRDLFWSSPEDLDGDCEKSNLRQAIDTKMKGTAV